MDDISPRQGLNVSPASQQFHLRMEQGSRISAQGHVGSFNNLTSFILPVTSDEYTENLRKIDKILEPRLSTHARVTRIDKIDICYPGTRHDILHRIESWITRNQQNEQCLCIVGVPGSGKSTIAATVARNVLDASESRILCAEFFIRRDVVETGDTNNIFPTIAQQLAQLSPTIASVIQKSLLQRPTSVYPLSNTQIDQLFLAPLCSITDTVVIIIDALDELVDPALFSRFLVYIIPNLPSNVRLLLTTRNEHDILVHLEQMITKISLELRVSDSVQDVKHYITEKLRDNLQLKFLDDEEWMDWPTAQQIQSLCDHAAGLFVWGATAVSHITQIVYEDGLAGRDNALAEVNSLGMDDLDALYGFILQRLLPRSHPSAKLDYIRRVIGLLVVSQVPLNIGTIRHFLDIESSQFDIKHFIQRARSILVPGLAHINNETVPQMHKSFVDFVTSPRAKEFQIHEPYHHGLTVCCALKSMEHLHFNMGSLDSSYLPNKDVKDLEQRLLQIPPHIWYSCHHWSQHLLLMEKAHVLSLEAFKDFMEINFLFWLEVLSLSGSLSIAAPSMKILAQSIRNQDQDFEHFVQDATRFITSNAQCMAYSAPHIYISALPLSPSSSVVANHYLRQYPRTMSASQGKNDNWDAALVVIEGAHSGQVHSVAFSPDGKCIASGGVDRTMFIWDVATGSLLARCEGHTDQILSVAFSSNGKHIASGSRDQSVRVWDARSGDLVAGPFKQHTDGVTCIVFSPDDGECIASGAGHSILIWNAMSGRIITGPLQMYAGEAGVIAAVAFSSDGSHVISVSNNNITQIWDSHSGEERARKVKGPAIPRYYAFPALSYDGRHVVSPFGNEIQVWRADTGRIIEYFELKGAWSSVAFSQDGSHLVAGCDDKVVTLVWNSGLAVGGPFDLDRKWVTSVALSSDGELMVAGCKEGQIYVWEAHGDKSHTHEHADGVHSVAISPDGKTIASGSNDQTVQIWDLETGGLLAGPFKRPSHVFSIAFCPTNGNYLVSGYTDGTVFIWDIKARKMVAGPWKGHKEHINSVAFSPDGHHIASGSYDSTIRIWNADTGETLSVLQAHTEAVNSVAFSLSGCYIASGSSDSTIRIWDAKTREAIDLFTHKEPVYSVAWCTDEIHIVSGAATICIWNIATGDLIRRLDGHPNFAVTSSVAFSANGDWVISGSYDCTIRIWDVQTGNTVAVLAGHTGAIRSVQLCPDGIHLVSGSYDRTLRIWNFSKITKSLVATYSHQQTPIQYKDSSNMVDGWIMGPDKQLLFWVPPVYRTGLWRPSNTAVIGNNALRLDFAKFVHGTDWMRCRL